MIFWGGDLKQMIFHLQYLCTKSTLEKLYPMRIILKSSLQCVQDSALLLLKFLAAANPNSNIIPSWAEARQPTEVDVSQITLSQWLNMWGKLCYGAAGLSDFPAWVQMLPEVLFKIIDVERKDLYKSLSWVYFL